MKLVLEIINATIGYQKPLVSGINAALQPGEICLLIGSNGQGKTTLIKTILGQTPLLGGQILVEGNNISKLNTKELSKQISIVFSKSNIPAHYTVWDLIALGKYIHYPYYFSLNSEDKKEISEIIDLLDLKIHTHTLLTHLSDGNLQKAFIGRALSQNTPILFLDEPTTHLDEQNRKNLLSLLRSLAKEKNKTILFSSHNIYGSSEVADTIWEIRQGALESGLAEDLLLKHIRRNNAELLTEGTLPTILAPDLEKGLLKNALKKNLSGNLSSLTIILDNHHWIIKIVDRSVSFDTLSELIFWLQSNQY